ncbi:DUF1097 domain-containing protein [Papillibacter cinnamivorans]|uniref:DUF1097 domain-containing protein n=1 Tax=Papillibacter cinnamivorans DSM 12816 TaxID=1122930 RepID=A0A1W2AB05_9FIRM|nr:DUF1097 domain-containing protein [Papillibacter cinnamivorans]SMC57895.1 Protein of unknown function [Papillibacter cinnamivorans DSM 12816]
MNKRYLWWWTVWIGLASGLFCIIYANLPIMKHNIMWMAFVALPIYFGVGAPLKKFPHFFFSMLSGVAWGMVMLFFIGKMMGAGFTAPVSMFVVVGICTTLCVGLHMILLGNTVFGVVPMIFGGLSMTFCAGGQNLIGVIGSLTGGFLLGVAISEGGRLMQKMKYFSEKPETPEETKAESAEAER